MVSKARFQVRSDSQCINQYSQLQNTFSLYRMDPLHEVMEPDGKVDPIKLEEWIVKARLDPNDPENEELISK